MEETEMKTMVFRLSLPIVLVFGQQKDSMSNYSGNKGKLANPNQKKENLLLLKCIKMITH